MESPIYTIILFYNFTDIENPEALRVSQRELCERLNLKGRILLAEEGINATLEGTKEAIEEYKAALRSDPRFANTNFKESAGTGSAFPKLVVKVRKEIVTLGAGRFDVKKETAKELTAEELSKWYENNEDFVVLDLRNDYEVQSGYFDRTINPKLDNFRDLPQKLPELAHLKDKKVLAVCTGGIRCEKATCLMTREGFTDLYQLKDGIHTYMEKFPGQNFKGTLFVFDNRMTTDVVDTPGKIVVGACTFCEKPTEDYANDDSVRPSKKILCCAECYSLRADSLRVSVS
jgi:UPF0176 protein